MLRNMGMLVLLSIAFSLAGACASSSGGLRATTRVQSLDRGSLDARGLKPVEGAKVALECPEAQVRELGTTSADGTLAVDADQPTRLDCQVAVTHQGHKQVKAAVSSVCTDWAPGGVCRGIDLRTVLQPDTQAAAGAAAGR